MVAMLAPPCRPSNATVITDPEVPASLYVLSQLADDDVDWLVANGRHHAFAAGEVIIREGASTAVVYIILAGQVAITSSDGTRLSECIRGGLLGEVSFLDGRPATATVTAVSDVIAGAIGHARLLSKLERDTAFGSRFYRALGTTVADRLRYNTPTSASSIDDVEPRFLENLPLAEARLSRLLRRFDGPRDAVTLNGDDCTIHDVVRVANRRVPVSVSRSARLRLERSRAVVDALARRPEAVYGLTTGLGALKDQRVAPSEMELFQQNILMSHAVGVGPEFDSEVVRAIMVARLNGMARGGAGVQPAVFQLLLDMLNAGLHPIVPSRGSLGMSDLAPLAHLALPLIGLGEAEYRGRRMSGSEALRAAGLQPVTLGPKDGLALCSANSASVGHGALVLASTLSLLAAADIASALSLEAFEGNVNALDPRAHAARPFAGVVATVERQNALLAGSRLWRLDLVRSVQDPLSLRCVTQVHGAAQDAFTLTRRTVEMELNGTSDNPVVLAEDEVIVSNGNFHTAALSLAFDTLAISVGQLTSLATSRVLKVMDTRFSGLPPALTHNPGRNTGLNMLQKTLTAMHAENRFLAAPASLDFVPIAGDIEDHATNSGFCVSKAEQMLGNLRRVLAIELLVAAQAISLRGEPRLGIGTAAAYQLLREVIPFVTDDRLLNPLVEAVSELLVTGRLVEEAGRAADNCFGTLLTS
jgi:histidine ammonia-lyase